MVVPAELLQQLLQLVVAAPREQPLAMRLAQACVTILEVEGVALTLSATSPTRLTVAATDRVIADLDQAQDMLTEGPSWDAERLGQVVMTDLGGTDEPRWAQFVPAARQSVGPRTVIALPMCFQNEVIGVLTAHATDTWNPSISSAWGTFLANAVAAALMGAPLPDEDDEDSPWSERAKVHQATGIVIAQLAIPPQDALAVLRAHAFAVGSNLNAVADDVLRGTITFGKDNLT